MEIMKLQFRKGRNGSVISRLPSNKVVLPARGFAPQAGEEWECRVEERERYAIAFPIKRVETITIYPASISPQPEFCYIKEWRSGMLTIKKEEIRPRPVRIEKAWGYTFRVYFDDNGHEFSDTFSVEYLMRMLDLNPQLFSSCEGVGEVISLIESRKALYERVKAEIPKFGEALEVVFEEEGHEWLCLKETLENLKAEWEAAKRRAYELSPEYVYDHNRGECPHGIPIYRSVTPPNKDLDPLDDYTITYHFRCGICRQAYNEALEHASTVGTRVRELDYKLKRMAFRIVEEAKERSGVSWVVVHAYSNWCPQCGVDGTLCPDILYPIFHEDHRPLDEFERPTDWALYAYLRRKRERGG